ncbi:hypothetical protein IFM89_018295 [Coptis chinensis]|uniref:Autophagy-related protein 18f n=1 Tax=Coptis chinensis TaxID=261450 RepID=A0A835H1J6_9MAGN|nr:hypothetical protein IFM89_018295 [Coptis chinensis]
MRNDVQKTIGGVPRSGKSNGFYRIRFWSLSWLLEDCIFRCFYCCFIREVCWSSVASSIVDKIEDASGDQAISTEIVVVCHAYSSYEVVGNGSFFWGRNVQDGSAPSYNGIVSNGFEQGSGNFGPSVVRFYSFKSQSYVHILKFRSAVYLGKIHCFDAATLEMEYTLLTYPLVSSVPGSGGIGCGPLAVGPRWLAYSGSPVAVSNAGRVSPTPAASLSGLPSNGSLVAHYAKESSKQLAAGIVTLGDIGYKKLSRYYSELLPDGNGSLKSGSPGWKPINNGLLPDADNAGMVIVRDIVCKSVVTQFRAHRNPISALSFDPSGTLLVTASIQGQTLNVFRIMPSGSNSDDSYMHLYKLQRGLTNAFIQGTSHLFAINPAGGTVLPSIDSSFTNGNNGLGVTPKSAVRWPPSSGPTNFNQQNLFASGPPVTLSVVSRIRNGNSGWKGTVSGAAAAATGRISALSGATASVFHNCKGNGIYAGTSSLRTKYHLLVFSPSGSVIQYVLAKASPGIDSEMIVSRSTPFHDATPDSDARFIVEALQNNKIYPEEMRNGSSDYPTTKSKTNTGSEERHHLYISEAELQMHQAQIPLWAKPEIYFQTVVMDGLETEGESSGGETEIERFPIRVIEARSKDLVPVCDYLQTHNLQQSRGSTFESSRSAQLLQQKSGLSEGGRLSCRNSCTSLSSSSEGAALAEFCNGIDEKGWGGLHTELAEGFVHSNDSPKMKTRLEYVNNSDRPKVESGLKFVNNNKESLKMDSHLNSDHELD